MYLKKATRESPKHHWGTIAWYTTFLILVPTIIIYLFSFDALRYYFPVVDLIANVFATMGPQDGIFNDLYSLSPNNVIAFLSTNFINLIALIGVSWNGIYQAFLKKDIWHGIRVTLVMYIVTYLLPTQFIPYILEKFHEKLDHYLHQTQQPKHHWIGYIFGAILIVVLVSLETLFIHLYVG